MSSSNSRWRDPESRGSQSPPQYNAGYIPAPYTMDTSYGNAHQQQQQRQQQQQQFQYSSYGDHRQNQPYNAAPAQAQARVYDVSPEMHDVNLYSNPQQQQQQYVVHQPPPLGQQQQQQYTPMMPTTAFGGSGGGAGGGYQLKDSTPVDQPGATAGEDHDRNQDPATAPDGVLPPPVEAHKRRQLWLWALRYFVVAAVVFVAFLVPILVTVKDEEVDLNDAVAVKSKRKAQLIYFVFSWLLVSWVSFVFFDLVGLALPYLFRFIARSVCLFPSSPLDIINYNKQIWKRADRGAFL